MAADTLMCVVVDAEWGGGMDGTYGLGVRLSGWPPPPVSNSWRRWLDCVGD